MNPQELGELRGKVGWVVSPHPYRKMGVCLQTEAPYPFLSRSHLCFGPVIWRPQRSLIPTKSPRSGLLCAPRQNPRRAGVACQWDFARFHLSELRKAEEGRLLGCRSTSWDWGLG